MNNNSIKIFTFRQIIEVYLVKLGFEQILILRVSYSVQKIYFIEIHFISFLYVENDVGNRIVEGVKIHLF